MNSNRGKKKKKGNSPFNLFYSEGSLTFGVASKELRNGKERLAKLGNSNGLQNGASEEKSAWSTIKNL